MHRNRFPCNRHGPLREWDIHHHVVMRHQVEVEVWPPRTEVHFQDERWANTLTTQARFEAKVFNSDQGVRWQVLNLDGGTGAGSIDASGLYLAPKKGALKSGYTDIVVATSRENPVRKAYAWVTVCGFGPEEAPQARIDIWPRRVNLYYPVDNSPHQDPHNPHIDDSNNMQLFEATIRDSDETLIEWKVGGVTQPTPNPTNQFLYRITGSGPLTTVPVRALIKNQPGIFAEAKVTLLNYDWPALRN